MKQHILLVCFSLFISHTKPQECCSPALTPSKPIKRKAEPTKESSSKKRRYDDLRDYNISPLTQADVDEQNSTVQSFVNTLSDTGKENLLRTTVNAMRWSDCKKIWKTISAEQDDLSQKKLQTFLTSLSSEEYQVFVEKSQNPSEFIQTDNEAVAEAFALYRADYAKKENPLIQAIEAERKEKAEKKAQALLAELDPAIKEALQAQLLSQFLSMPLPPLPAQPPAHSFGAHYNGS